MSLITAAAARGTTARLLGRRIVVPEPYDHAQGTARMVASCCNSAEDECDCGVSCRCSCLQCMECQDCANDEFDQQKRLEDLTQLAPEERS